MHFFLELPWLTQAFVLLILALTTWMLFFKYDERTIAQGPTFLTTFGIFGCFLGIAIGLLHFDVANVQGSVPALVSGIKTSFWSSVAGIFGALAIKFRVLISGWSGEENDTVEGATIDDLAFLLKDLRKAIAGTDENSLVSQTKLLRQDISARLDRLQKSYEVFADRVADDNSKALIRGLNVVIRDFNAKVNEQFGENFVHLNAAIAKVVVWQEQYAEQIAEMIEQQESCAKNMTIASARYEDLLSNANALAAVSTSLNELVKELNNQRTGETQGADDFTPPAGHAQNPSQVAGTL